MSTTKSQYGCQHRYKPLNVISNSNLFGVDHCSKAATLNPDNIPATFVTFDTCKKLITKQCRVLWQTRRQRANTGKATFVSAFSLAVLLYCTSYCTFLIVSLSK